MSTLKQNVVANYLGGAWTILMGVAFVPVYIHFLGVEAYGLIGVYVGGPVRHGHDPDDQPRNGPLQRRGA